MRDEGKTLLLLGIQWVTSLQKLIRFMHQKERRLRELGHRWGSFTGITGRKHFAVWRTGSSEDHNYWGKCAGLICRNSKCKRPKVVGKRCRKGQFLPFSGLQPESCLPEPEGNSWLAGCAYSWTHAAADRKVWIQEIFRKQWLQKKIYVLRFFITSFKDKQELSSVFHLFTILTEVLWCTSTQWYSMIREEKSFVTFHPLREGHINHITIK